MNRSLRALGVLGILGALAQVAGAAENQDPSWPCIQPKVNEISIGQMWPYPPTDAASAPLDAEAQQLVSILSLRRVTEDQVKQYVADFAAAHPDAGLEDYTAIYAALLHNINLTRGRIINGIGRYAEGQQTRSQAIDEKRTTMSEEEAKSDPDFDKIDKLEAEIDWDERIYKDRERSLTYVCETPVILEKRAYALAQILAPYAGD